MVSVVPGVKVEAVVVCGMLDSREGMRKAERITREGTLSYESSTGLILGNVEVRLNVLLECE